MEFTMKRPLGPGVHLLLATVCWSAVFFVVGRLFPTLPHAMTTPGPPPALSSPSRPPLTATDVQLAERIVATSNDVYKIMDAIVEVFEGSVCELGDEGAWSRIRLLLKSNRHVARYRVEHACPDIEMKNGSSLVGLLYNMKPRCVTSSTGPN